MATIEAVVFDIGNVLLEWRPDAFYDAHLGRDRRRAFFEETGIEAINEEVDRGAAFKPTIYALADAHPAWADEIRMWHDRWLEIASPDIPVSAAILRQLKAQGMPVFALSNFGVGTFEIAEQAYPILTEFDRRYVSGYLGVIKPDPRIYEILEDDCGVDTAGLFFIDDRPENIEAATARGWQGHIFDGHESLRARLTAEGVLDP